jgi:hypothetical protein
MSYQLQAHFLLKTQNTMFKKCENNLFAKRHVRFQIAIHKRTP